jgi:hypothetical protein
MAAYPVKTIEKTNTNGVKRVDSNEFDIVTLYVPRGSWEKLSTSDPST